MNIHDWFPVGLTSLISLQSQGLSPKNWCFWTVMLEETLESPLDCKEIQPVLNIYWKDWCWSWMFNALATWCEELTHRKRPWCWERLKVGGEGDDRGWDGGMASLTLWAWVWASSRSWWRTKEDWHAAVHGVAKSQTWLNDWTDTILIYHSLECECALLWQLTKRYN